MSFVGDFWAMIMENIGLLVILIVVIIWFVLVLLKNKRAKKKIETKQKEQESIDTKITPPINTIPVAPKPKIEDDEPAPFFASVFEFEKKEERDDESKFGNDIVSLSNIVEKKELRLNSDILSDYNELTKLHTEVVKNKEQVLEYGRRLSKIYNKYILRERQLEGMINGMGRLIETLEINEVKEPDGEIRR